MRYRLLLLIALFVVLAALVVACGGGAAQSRPREVSLAPAPPAGSVVLAQESRELAVAIAVRPGRPLGVTATIVGQSGRGVDGLEVELAAPGSSRAGRPCGHGCYRATLPSAPTQLTVKVTGAGSPRTVVFPMAKRWPPADGRAFLGRASQAFLRLRSVQLDERLSSGPGHSIFTKWKLAAPDRLEYEIRNGPGGIVIGTRRWDRPKPGAPWTSSPTTLLRQPTAPWGTRIANAHVLAETPGRLTASWVDPVVPAWFIGTFDRRTALPVELRMTAPAHFMRHRYVGFNRNVRIVPPTSTK